MPGEGDRGIYGAESAEPVGEMMMIGVRLLGGVGGLLSGMIEVVVSVVTSLPSCSLRRLLIGIGHHGMGATIPVGFCWNGRSLLGMGEFMIWLIVIG